jgi:hypothetical protein
VHYTVLCQPTDEISGLKHKARKIKNHATLSLFIVMVSCTCVCLNTIGRCSVIAAFSFDIKMPNPASVLLIA